MIYIAHRGNIDGPNPLLENSPEYIQEAINRGYDVEIDLRVINGRLWLGHDYPQYKITKKWLLERKNNLWIHAKSFLTASWLANFGQEIVYFCHNSDSFTLTSNGKIWLHELSQSPGQKCIVPLLSKSEIKKYKYKNFGAVCSDFILDCNQKFK